MKNHRSLSHLGLFVVSVIYAVNYSLAKQITPNPIHPFAIILIRVFCSLPVFWFIHRFFIGEKIQSFRDYFLLFLAAVFGVATNQLFFFKGLSLTSPANASLIMTVTPVLVLLTSVLVLNERFTWQKALGVALGFSGAVLLIVRTNDGLSSDGFWGDVFIFINAASYGIYLVLVKPLFARYHPITIVYWAFLFGSVMVLPFGWGELVAIDWDSIGWKEVGVLFEIVAGITVLAYLLNAYALQHLNASAVGAYIYLQPLMAISIATFFGGYPFTFSLALNGLIIFAGVFLATRK